ncbi:MAG TPA: BamA/TamA family outer membrane protein [Vicinamibacterales bacterium]|nr:BamA/TamA family outer membrane protein [Vicinamibacterales bacterium]
MMRLLSRFLTAILFIAHVQAAFAQEPGSRAEEQARQQEAKARTVTTYVSPWIEQRLLAVENAGGFGVARGLVVKFGDIKRGSGFAPGLGYGYTTSGGGALAAKGVYSVRNYKLLQVSAQSPPFSADRILFRARARWQDAPKVRLYPLGSDPANLRTDYAERKTEVSGEALLKPVRFLRFGGGVGVEWFDTEFSHDENPIGLTLFDALPGAGADPRYIHSRVSAAFDLRDSEGYTRRGTLLSTTYHNYHADSSGRYSFDRVDGSAEQYLPILHGNWVIFLGLWASTTMTEDGGQVPFFLMPDVGGHDLRGFSNYRFRDRHSISWTAEYRWYAQEFLDVALFYDAGKTVPTRGALDFKGLHSSIGGGVRLHTSISTLLRLELAHSREGYRFLIGFSPVGP